MPANVQVSTNLGKVFETGNLGVEAFGIFWDAFSSILWDPERLKAQQSVVRPLPAEWSLSLARHTVMSAYIGMLWGSPSRAVCCRLSALLVITTMILECKPHSYDLNYV